MDVQKHIGQKLKEAREARKMSAVDAAKKIGKSKSTLYNWEKGDADPGADNLLKLCHLYSVDLNFFFPKQEVENHLLLSDDELSVLNAYRSASPKGKRVILSTINAIKDEC